MAKVHQVAGRVFARILKEAGTFPINPAQGRILFVLWRVGKISISGLAKETALEPSTLTSMLDRLENAGLVRRTAAPDDRRIVMIERTEADLALEKRYGEVSAQMTELYYRGLSQREIDAFETTLEKILEDLAEAERGPKA